MKINPVIISDGAIEEIKTILETKNIPDDHKLRIGVKGGVGCSGANFVLGFDKKTGHDDEFEINGLPLLIDKRHVMFLIGIKLEFYNGADARGFKFVRNENLPQ